MKIMRRAIFGLRCTKCGKTGSLAKLGESGYDDAFEKENEGWAVETGETLCPECSAKKNGIFQLDFFGEVSV